MKIPNQTQPDGQTEVVLFGRKVLVNKDLHDKAFSVKLYDTKELELGTYMCLNPEPGTDMKEAIWNCSDKEVSEAAEHAMETTIDLVGI